MNVNNFDIARYFFGINAKSDHSGGPLYWSPTSIGRNFGAERLADAIFDSVDLNLTYSSKFSGFTMYVKFNRRYVVELVNRLARFNPSTIIFNVAGGDELLFFEAVCSMFDIPGVALLHNVDGYFQRVVAETLNISPSRAAIAYSEALENVVVGRQQVQFGRSDFVFGNFQTRTMTRSSLAGPVLGVGRFNTTTKRTQLTIDVSEKHDVQLVGRVERSHDLLVPPDVDFVEYVADVAPYFARARVLAIPSLVESFPNVVLEAWAAGVPVVGVADCPAMCGLIDDGVDGFLAPTAAEFASTVDRVYRLPTAKLREVAESASIKAKNYTADVVLRSFKEVVNRVTNNHGHPRR